MAHVAAQKDAAHMQRHQGHIHVMTVDGHTQYLSRSFLDLIGDLMPFPVQKLEKVTAASSKPVVPK